MTYDVVNANKRDFLTITEASEFLRLKVSRLRYEVFKKTIPFYKIGKSVRFSRADLLAWLESKKGGAQTFSSQKSRFMGRSND